MQQKKKYSMPLIDSISIDREITLVMASDDTPLDPLGSPSASGVGSKSNTSIKKKTSTSSFQKNPFNEPE